MTVRWRTAALACLFALLAGAGCGGGGGDRDAVEAPRVVILGIDGFDWAIVDPLVEAGRMPVLESLMARGTRADLLTLVPLEKSPVIWTSIATGRLPEQQGRGFLIESGPDSAKAYTAWNRTTRAFWNILPDEGYSVSVLGWLETWPAERIDGTIVSDYVLYDVSEREKRARFRHRTHPDELYSEIESLVRLPTDVTEEQLSKLISGPIPGPDAAAAMRRSADDLRWIYAGDLSFTALGCEFLENRPEDVMAIYLRGPDAACHKFWGDRERLAAGDSVEHVTTFGETVDLYFEETDRMVGEIVSRIDLERTNLLIVSDHGFKGGSKNPDGSPRLGIWMHHELGTILLAGPGARGAGVRAEGARVIDVLPTLLHLLDLPVGEDLDGEVATWLLSEEGGAEREVATIATYETGEPPDIPTDAESPIDDQIAERVRALGYVE